MSGFGDELGRLIPHMRRFARALVRGHSSQVADDLVQETVVLAMRAETIARGTHLRSWCFSTLIRLHRHLDQTSNGTTELGAPSPAPLSEAAPTRGTLAFMPRDIARLDMLSPDHREVLLLTVLVGMTYAQVADTLHITVEAVMARLDMARGVLARGQRPVAGETSSSSGAFLQKNGRAAQYLHVVK